MNKLSLIHPYFDNKFVQEKAKNDKLQVKLFLIEHNAIKLATLINKINKKTVKCKCPTCHHIDVELGYRIPNHIKIQSNLRTNCIFKSILNHICNFFDIKYSSTNDNVHFTMLKEDSDIFTLGTLLTNATSLYDKNIINYKNFYEFLNTDDKDEEYKKLQTKNDNIELKLFLLNYIQQYELNQVMIEYNMRKGFCICENCNMHKYDDEYLYEGLSEDEREEVEIDERFDNYNSKFCKFIPTIQNDLKKFGLTFSYDYDEEDFKINDKSWISISFGKKLTNVTSINDPNVQNYISFVNYVYNLEIYSN
jgi:hypothetical protein